jgi:hypothetical protein
MTGDRCRARLRHRQSESNRGCPTEFPVQKQEGRFGAFACAMLKDPELELFDENESQSSDCDYSRKDKSLRLLCSRFMLEYSTSTEVGNFALSLPSRNRILDECRLVCRLTSTRQLCVWG